MAELVGGKVPCGGTVLSNEEWRTARREMHRLISAKLHGLDPALIQDSTQDALIRLQRACRRQEVRSLEAMWTTIAQRASHDQLRSYQREKKRMTSIDTLREQRAPAQDNERGLDVEPYSRAVFQILQYFYQNDKRDCALLAVAMMQGHDWKRVARKLDRSHAAVRQQWTRCVRSIKAVLAGQPSGTQLDAWAEGVVA